MRTLRLSLAGTVILMLLGGLGGTVVAQSEDDGHLVTPVTGDFQYFGKGKEYEADKTVVGDGSLIQYRDLEHERSYEWDDPRLPGTLEMHRHWDEFRLPGTAATTTVEWGEATLRDDEGAWQGPFFGTELPGRNNVLQFWLDGSGAYEGHYAVLTMDRGRAADLDIKGLIVAGEMPAFAGTPAE